MHNMHDQIEKVAKKAVLDAGQEVVKIFPQIQKLKDKATGYDVLTTADAAAEKIILDAVKLNFPDHSIFSEESGSNSLENDHKWFIDPLDGSKHVVRGLPYFCINLAVSYKDEIVLGITYIPLLDQLFEAKKGHGAYLNGQKIHVSDRYAFEQIIVNAEFPSRNFKVDWGASEYSKAFSQFEKLIKNVFRVRMIGSGPIGLAYTAMGGFDSYVRFQPYSIEDVAAGYLLVKEAGGQITDFDGNEVDILSHNKGLFAAGNSVVTDKIVEFLKDV